VTDNTELSVVAIISLETGTVGGWHGNKTQLQKKRIPSAVDRVEVVNMRASPRWGGLTGRPLPPSFPGSPSMPGAPSCPSRPTTPLGPWGPTTPWRREGRGVDEGEIFKTLYLHHIDPVTQYTYTTDMSTLCLFTHRERERERETDRERDWYQNVNMYIIYHQLGM